MLKRVLIACRGEIALRILRACREMGIETVTVYSQADADAMYVSLSNQSLCIGPPQASQSYLNQSAILTAALATGCDGVHPGYGFLSENAAFSDACAAHGLCFIGPKGDVIRRSGEKSAARGRMRQAGIPVTPGSSGSLSTLEAVREAANAVGYPVLLKASAGGGGRGIRRCNGEEELASAFLSAKAEAMSAFGSDEMYLEKCILNPRHIEVQILADEFGNVVYLGDRDCSAQRHNQKLLEEAPAWGLTPQLRRKMGQAAVAAAKAVGYVGCGTVEFLLDGTAFYFMEINARIQVEHGITELVTGIDLVRQQLRIASHLPLDFTQEDVSIRGCAIECRINAEIPEEDFRPCPGTVTFLHFPGGTGVRVDSCLYTGYTIPPYYDSLGAKIMAWAPTRLEAIRKLRRCLEEFTIEGIKTSAEFSYALLYHRDFIRGGYSTSFLQDNTAALLDFQRRVSQNEEGL